MKILLEIEASVEGTMPDDFDFLDLIGGALPVMFTSEEYAGTDEWALHIERISIREE